jgi:hypothetical protein
MITKLVRPAVLVLVCVVLSVAAGQGQGVLDSTYVILHLHGSDTASRIGGCIKSVGDINADGFDDISVSSLSPEATYIFYGGDPADTTADMTLPHYGEVAVIDLTGDGISELLLSDVYNDIPCEYGSIYFYRGYADHIESWPYDSLSPAPEECGDYWTNRRFGTPFAVAYIDSDSLGDMLTAKRRTPGGPTLYYYTGAPALDTTADWTYKIDDYSHQVPWRGFIDFNGDHQLDIFLGLYADLDTVSYIYVFLGPDFGSQPDVIIGHPDGFDTLKAESFAYQVSNVGDVDGDGWEDLGVLFFFEALIYLCGPDADTLYDYHLDDGAGYLAAAGDINGDGYNDLVAQNVGRSEYNMVDVYLGGEVFDEYVDERIVRGELPPLFLLDIGFRVAAAGDFNGDGIDDFMFSCMNFAHGDPHDVFVVRGTSDVVTSVDEAKENTLPEAYRLEQNYPNPFNQSTTIEFALIRRGTVSLDIYNVLGRHVAALIKSENRPAGTCRVEWDGQSEAGRELPSGIYLYRLSVGTGRTVRKMLLLK